MEQIVNWVAPIATIIAAMMTAANLGSRVTGWGFVVFTIGSLCWLTLGFYTGQTSLLVANGFLTVVNLVGIYRWLGRQAKYEDGSRRAAYRSARARVPTLFSAGGVVGAKLLGADGKPLATVVDTMLRCDNREMAYLVISDGGMMGVGEKLYALDPALVTFHRDAVHSDLTADTLAALPALEADNWPAALPRASTAEAVRPLIEAAE